MNKFKKNVSGSSNPPDELAQNVRKKIPFGRIIPPFFYKSSESGRFFNYSHDSNSIFWAREIKSEGVSGGTVQTQTRLHVTHNTTHHGFLVLYTVFIHYTCTFRLLLNDDSTKNLRRSTRPLEVTVLRNPILLHDSGVTFGSRCCEIDTSRLDGG